MDEILRSQMRREFHRVFRAFAEDPSALRGEEFLLGRLLHEHSEWHGVFGASEPRLVDVPGEVNPYLHISLHVAVEQQLESGDPPQTRETLARLTAAGLSPHEARHRIMTAVADEMADVTHTQSRFDAARFAARLQRLQP